MLVAEMSVNAVQVCFVAFMLLFRRDGVIRLKPLLTQSGRHDYDNDAKT